MGEKSARLTAKILSTVLFSERELRPPDVKVLPLRRDDGQTGDFVPNCQRKMDIEAALERLARANPRAAAAWTAVYRDGLSFAAAMKRARCGKTPFYRGKAFLKELLDA